MGVSEYPVVFKKEGSKVKFCIKKKVARVDHQIKLDTKCGVRYDDLCLATTPDQTLWIMLLL